MTDDSHPQGTIRKSDVSPWFVLGREAWIKGGLLYDIRWEAHFHWAQVKIGPLTVPPLGLSRHDRPQNISPLLVILTSRYTSGTSWSVSEPMMFGYTSAEGSALGDCTSNQVLVASTSSNVPTPIPNESYSLSRIINLGPTHMSEIRK